MNRHPEKPGVPRPTNRRDYSCLTSRPQSGNPKVFIFGLLNDHIQGKSPFVLFKLAILASDFAEDRPLVNESAF